MKRLEAEKRHRFYRHEITIPIRGSLKEAIREIEKLKGVEGVRSFLSELLVNLHKESKKTNKNTNHYKATVIFKTNSFDNVKRSKDIERAFKNKFERFDMVNQIVEEMLRDEGLVDEG